MSCCTQCAQAAFRIARSRLLIDALLDIAELQQNRTLATALRIIHAELAQASQSPAITRIPFRLNTVNNRS